VPKLLLDTLMEDSPQDGGELQFDQLLQGLAFAFEDQLPCANATD